MTTLVVTGATGHVGGAVARLLAEAGLDQVLLVRDPVRAPRLPRTEVRALTYGEERAAAAFAGVDVLLLVSAGESATRRQEHLSTVAAAAAAGVAHVVYTSFLNASPGATFSLARDHHATEQAIRGSDVEFTFLRDSFYADVFPLFVDDEGAIRGPAGDGRVSLVTRADVAAVAAGVLRDPARHRGRTLDLTGPEALTLAEVADSLSSRWGRPVRYVAETLEEARASRARLDPEPWQLEAWVSTYTAIAAGEVADVTGDVADVLGRPATPFAEVPLP